MLGTLSNSLDAAWRLTQTTVEWQKLALKWLMDRKQPLPLLLRQGVEELGGTYVKLGQFIASSPSLFPAEYVEAFQTCLDSTPPLPYSVIEQRLKEELGDKLAEFEFIDSQPLASASIAQVHAARLKTGEDVVLKVQKPGVDRLLKTDSQYMQFAGR